MDIILKFMALSRKENLPKNFGPRNQQQNNPAILSFYSKA